MSTKIGVRVPTILKLRASWRHFLWGWGWGSCRLSCLGFVSLIFDYPPNFPFVCRWGLVTGGMRTLRLLAGFFPSRRVREIGFPSQSGGTVPCKMSHSLALIALECCFDSWIYIDFWDWSLLTSADCKKWKIMVLGPLKCYTNFHGSLTTGSEVQMGDTEAARWPPKSSLFLFRKKRVLELQRCPHALQGLVYEQTAKHYSAHLCCCITVVITGEPTCVFCLVNVMTPALCCWCSCMRCQSSMLILREWYT